MRHDRFSAVLATSCMLLFAGAYVAQAEPFIYTGFDYAPNTIITGASSPNDVGFSDPWSATLLDVDLDLDTSTSMPYPAGVNLSEQTGQVHDFDGGLHWRQLSPAGQFSLDADQTYYISFLFKQIHDRSFKLRFTAEGDAIGAEKIDIAAGSDRGFRFRFNNGAQEEPDPGPETDGDTTYFLVAKIDANPAGFDPSFLKIYEVGTDTVGGEPDTWDISMPNVSLEGTIDRIDIDSNRNTSSSTGLKANNMMDEVRVGTRWADVTGVPEPSTCILCLFALGAFGCRQLLKMRIVA